MNGRLGVVIAFILMLQVVAFSACNNGEDKTTKQSKQQGIISGNAMLLCDETIFPVIEDEVSVFEGVYRNVGLDVVPLPEVDVVNKLRRGDAQLAVLTRRLTDLEDSIFRVKTIIPRTSSFATDALAIVSSKSNADSMLTVQDVVNMVKGDAGNRILVFDNKNSSALRYFKELANIDSINNDRGVYAVNGALELLKYVENNKNAYGVIGLNWLYQPSNEMESAIGNIQVVGIKDEGADGDVYYKPTQSNLALNLYPFQRKLYLINVQGKNSVGMGFSAFLYDERGQKIVLKSGLLPDSIPSREVIIKN